MCKNRSVVFLWFAVAVAGSFDIMYDQLYMIRLI